MFTTLGMLEDSKIVHRGYPTMDRERKPLCCVGNRQHVRLYTYVGDADEDVPNAVFSVLATAGIAMSRLCTTCFSGPGHNREAYRLYLKARGGDLPRR